MAQVWYSPDEIATAVRPVPRLLVSVGVDLSDVPPLPNWPLTPSPQHDTSPLSRIAQVCAAPEEIATAVRPMPRLLVRVGVPLLDVSPLPNWPLEPRPQHETLPLSRMAQVCIPPAESVVSVKTDPSWKPGLLSCDRWRMTSFTVSFSGSVVRLLSISASVAAAIPKKIIRLERKIAVNNFSPLSDETAIVGRLNDTQK